MADHRHGLGALHGVRKRRHSLCLQSPGNQIRLYDKMGNFKRTFDYRWQPATVPADGKIGQSGGVTVALAFSRGPAQTFMFVVNQNNSPIAIVERQSGNVVSTLGQIGRLAKQSLHCREPRPQDSQVYAKVHAVTVRLATPLD